MKKQLLALLMLFSIALIPTQTSAITPSTIAYKSAAACIGILAGMNTLAYGKVIYEMFKDSLRYDRKTLHYNALIQMSIPAACLAHYSYLCFKEILAANSEDLYNNDSDKITTSNPTE